MENAFRQLWIDSGFFDFFWKFLILRQFRAIFLVKKYFKEPKRILSNIFLVISDPQCYVSHFQTSTRSLRLKMRSVFENFRIFSHFGLSFFKTYSKISKRILSNIFWYPQIRNVMCLIFSHQLRLYDLKCLQHSKIFKFLVILGLFGLKKFQKTQKKNLQKSWYPQICNIACIIWSHHWGLFNLKCVQYSKIFHFLSFWAIVRQKFLWKIEKKMVKKMLVPSDMQCCVCVILSHQPGL